METVSLTAGHFETDHIYRAVHHGLSGTSYQPKVNLVTTITPSQNNETLKSPGRSLKSILPLENEDFDADANELPEYHESTRIQSPPTQHRSLFDELLASEGIAGPSSGIKPQPNGLNKAMANMPPTSSSMPLPPSSIQNDNNNNHVLSKKQPNDPMNPANRNVVSTSKDNHSSRSNSAGDSRSDSKSESFEIDW